MRRAKLLVTVDFLTTCDWRAVLPRTWKIVGVDGADGRTDRAVVFLEASGLEDGPDLDLIIQVDATDWSTSYTLVKRDGS